MPDTPHWARINEIDCSRSRTIEARSRVHGDGVGRYHAPVQGKRLVIFLLGALLLLLAFIFWIGAYGERGRAFERPSAAEDANEAGR